MSESTAPLSGGKLVAVALAFALVAALINLMYVTWVKQQNEINSIQVPVTTKALKRGSRLSMRDIETIRVPETFREAIFSETGLAAIEFRDVQVLAQEGKVVQRQVGRNSIVTYHMFRAPDDQRNDDRVEPGKVLASLPIDGKNQPGNLLPGMIVDIAAPFDTGGAIPEMVTVMERVEVFAMDRHIAPESDQPADTRDRSVSARLGNFRAITIEVEPEVAKSLLMIQDMARGGQFHLFVRNPGDQTPRKIDPDRLNDRVVDMLSKRLGGTTGL